jgi:hypothetical protein
MTDHALAARLPANKTGGALAVPVLDARQLELVRLLATEGTREHTIRRALELTPSQWKRLKEDSEDGDLSPLALEEGRAEGAGEIITFMKNKMKNEGSERAAEWLAANIFQINKGDGNGEAPRVLIQINAALTPDEYAKVIHVQQTS